MKAIKHQKESVSSHSYRNLEAEGRPSATAPELMKLADASLAVLATNGDRKDGSWQYSAKMSDGLSLLISCAGPNLPASVPTDMVFPADIPKEPDWVGPSRLKVAAPLVALDIAWQENVPLRIMMFSRGDWESELLAMVGVVFEPTIPLRV